MLCGELEALVADRSLCSAARPTASRSRVLAAPRELRSLDAKVFVTKVASSDEPKGPFSEALLALPCVSLFEYWTYKVAEFTEDGVDLQK